MQSNKRRPTQYRHNVDAQKSKETYVHTHTHTHTSTDSQKFLRIISKKTHSYSQEGCGKQAYKKTMKKIFKKMEEYVIK